MPPLLKIISETETERERENYISQEFWWMHKSSQEKKRGENGWWWGDEWRERESLAKKAALSESAFSFKKALRYLRGARAKNTCKMHLKSLDRALIHTLSLWKKKSWSYDVDDDDDGGDGDGDGDGGPIKASLVKCTREFLASKEQRNRESESVWERFSWLLKTV